MKKIVGLGACVYDTLINCDRFPTEDTKQKADSVFVTGGGPVCNALVIAGKLGIYVGGSEEAYEKMKPVLLYMGENVIRLGDNGKGLVMKICHNALVSQIQNGVNETSTLAGLNGIDILTFAQAISYGGAGNWYLDSKKDALSREDYTTAFSIENRHINKLYYSIE